MLMKRKLNISIYTALAGALLLLAADVCAGNCSKKQAGIADTTVTAGSFNMLAPALASTGQTDYWSSMLSDFGV